MDVSKSTYFEVVDGANNVVKITSDAAEALRALPFGGELFDVAKFTIATDSGLAIFIFKEVVKVS